VTYWAVNAVLRPTCTFQWIIEQPQTRVTVIFSKNCQTCSKLHHLYIICSKCPLPMCRPTKISAECRELKKTADHERCYVSCCWRRVYMLMRTCVRDGAWGQTFRTYDRWERTSPTLKLSPHLFNPKCMQFPRNHAFWHAARGNRFSGLTSTLAENKRLRKK